MDTISKDKGRIWDSLQFKFGLSYILIIAGVLLLLNTYPLRVSQDLVFRSKATTLQSSVSVMVYSLSGLDRLTEENVSQAMAVVEETGLSRILVTDSAGKVLYDTRETNDALGEYSFYTEIVQALLGNDVFSSSYRGGAFRSRAASPVLYQNQIIGAVYAYEYDTEQAALLEGLQGNLLRLSAGIAVVVLCLSGLLSRALTRKIGQLLTAKSEDADKLMGFECGADDYVTKPFNILELKARVRALLRRAAGTQRNRGAVLTAGDLSLNTEERVAIRDGKTVDLTAKEYDLIELLMRNPRRVYSRENLMNVVWGYAYAGDYRTVDVHIRRLREKLEKNPAEPEYIMTKWGVGYYFKG